MSVQEATSSAMKAPWTLILTAGGERIVSLSEEILLSSRAGRRPSDMIEQVRVMKQRIRCVYDFNGSPHQCFSEKRE